MQIFKLTGIYLACPAAIPKESCIIFLKVVCISAFFLNSLLYLLTFSFHNPRSYDFSSLHLYAYYHRPNYHFNGAVHAIHIVTSADYAF